MNARAIKKKLMRRKEGGRAVLTLKLPLSVLATPPVPKPIFNGFKEQRWDGEWLSQDGQEQLFIEKYTAWDKPDELREANNTFTELIQHEQGWWEWWSGYRMSRTVPEGYREVWIPSETKVRLDDVLAWAEHAEWLEGLQQGKQGPLVDLFDAAGDRARWHHWAIEGERLVFSCGVKWYSARSKFRFCAAMKRAIKAAAKAGIKVKI